ncbi:MAG: 2Fe-2S iron-sulfur cluster-binding protein [Gammaproteobacteria bacterium]|nr:2Fe-2S iron-sulfur cluster-binding protein [Gammaproteobacteria bacterium]
MLKFRSLEISSLRPAGESAVTLSFRVPSELRDEFTSLPGQHIVLRAEIDGVEQRRTYSLVNAGGSHTLEIGVRVHEHGTISRHIAQSLQVGDSVDVLPPNGSFHTPLEMHEERRYVAFASGCGITPVLSLVKSVLLEEPRSRFVVFFGNRTAARAMFLEELLGLKNSYLERLAVYFIMSREPQDGELFNGRIDSAKVVTFADVLFLPKATHAFFLCGPDTMMEEVASELTSLGVEGDRIHVEHFSVDTVARSERPVAAARVSAGDAEITVVMDGRRRTFTMAQGDETLLEAALVVGIDLPYSCCAGVCSTCRTKVISGEVVMEENYALEPWEVEEGYVLACQSRPVTSKLVLDYDDV